MPGSPRRTILQASMWAAIALVGANGAGGVTAQTLSDSIRDRLLARLENESLRLRRFYELRGVRPAWTGESGPLLGAAQLQGILSGADQDGLRVADYPLPDLHPPLHPDSLAALDLALSRAALAYVSDLATGRVDPTAVDTQWAAAPRQTDLGRGLAPAVDTWRVSSLAKMFAPPYLGYERLRAALARYREIATRGGWPALAAGPPLAPGDTGVRVRALRTRLGLEGDVAHDDGSARYDAALAQAVRRFQARHGLPPDGEIGPVTLTALNIPAETRVHQIEVNLERWRWLPRVSNERYVMVSTVAFELAVVESGRTVLSMRAIVGRPDWPTPIVSGRLTGLVFAPVWNIPRTIALEEILPVARRDTAYLRRERIRVFQDSTAVAELDPATVDWSQASDTAFAWGLRQDPGGTNPLGGVKFVFPSRFNVAIHDTPHRALFRQQVRAASHGCVRVERAAELAEYLLHDPARWPRDSIGAAMSRPREHWVALAEPVAVHLCYWTAWVDEDGTAEFRDDLYGWDARLGRALAARR